MAEALSMDLRRRVLAAIAEGVSGRGAGRREQQKSQQQCIHIERESPRRPVCGGAIGSHRSHRPYDGGFSYTALTKWPRSETGVHRARPCPGEVSRGGTFR